MSRFLREVHWAKKNGGDVGQVIRRYHKWYRNVYIYNDFCIKHILTGGGKDLTLATNLVNAALHLTGCECISNPKLENPAISGGLIHKDIEQDILISHQRAGRSGEEAAVDRIGLVFFREVFAQLKLRNFIEKDLTQLSSAGATLPC